MIPVAWFVVFQGAFLPQVQAAVTIDAAIMPIDTQWQLLQATVRISKDQDTPPFATGVIVAERGASLYILTANHAVPRTETRIFQFFNQATYPKVSEEVILNDPVIRSPEADFALIKLAVPKGEFKTAKLATPKTRPNRFPAPGVAIGCPGGSAPLVRSDTILGKRFMVRPEGNAYFWETAVAPEGGMSGGPLFTTKGELLGVCTAVSGGSGFFTHTDEILASLKRNGYAWIYEGK
ncbi:MAG: S1 family peptidase [Fimbriiglobus sp.]